CAHESSCSGTWSEPGTRMCSSSIRSKRCSASASRSFMRLPCSTKREGSLQAIFLRSKLGGFGRSTRLSVDGLLGFPASSNALELLARTLDRDLKAEDAQTFVPAALSVEVPIEEQPRREAGAP